MKRRHNLWANTEPISMRVPFSLLFLGWWVSQQRWMVTGQYYYSKPSVSVSPEVVTLGGSVSVHCSNANHPHAQFFLYKGNSDSRPLFSKVATGYGVVFIISITKISDAGIYRCLYCFISGPNEACSYYSDEVHIHVTGQYFPKPSVSVSPEVVTLGGSVSVRCSNAIYPYAEFFLYKGKSYSYALSSKVATDYGVEFIISITSISDAGIYQCLYHSGQDSETGWSDYSDAVHINVTDPSIPKPSIRVKSKRLNAVHSNVTIECQGQEAGLTFSLRKAETGEVLQVEGPPTAKANFHFRQVKREEAGSYICQYHRRSTPFVWSEPSEPVQLLLEGQYSKPSVSVSPEVVTLGGSVSVRCSNASHPHGEFFLYKGNSDSPALPSKMATGYGDEFIISNTSISDAGIYYCSYCFTSGSDKACSYQSDEVHINVTDPSIPKPSIKVKPKRLNAVHSDVNIECEGQGDGLTFSLRKAGTREVLQVEAPSTATANFHFRQVKGEVAGSYICQYHRRNTPFVWSEPSEPVQLLLEDSSLRKPSINLKPEGPHDIGVNVTIECKVPEDRLNFSLHKSKKLKALQVKEPQGDTATFSLPAVSLEDAGNYTCRYSRRGNRFVYSESSASVEVIVTGMHGKPFMTIIWASIAAGLLVLFLLVLIFVLCKKRKNGSTIKERNQAVNMILEQDAGIDHEDGADHDGIAYAVLNIQQPANQHRAPESCVYASVVKGQNQRSPI